MSENDLSVARRIAEAAAAEGGRVYFVGGFVRDRLLGRENKDIDIEVHGIPFEALTRILSALGEPVLMGASFGVMGLRHCELDIAMPRSEKATGRGHKDFAVSVDPFLGEEKAARRRDFTINAMMEDVLSGEVLDFFGGLADLKGRRIRHVNDQSFVEDPLRVLRACQFAARFEFNVAPETAALCSRMALDALARERVMGEMEKALLKAAKPSIFLRELREMDQLGFWFPEAKALIGVPQPPKYHPEGDAWTHTLQALDEAALLRDRARQPLWFMLASLCHDMGKAVATECVGGEYRAYRHELLGLPIVSRFLDRLTGETKLKEYVLNMTRLHMVPNAMAFSDARHRTWMKLFDRSVCPEDLLLLAKADFLGCRGAEQSREERLRLYAPTEERLRALLRDYRELMARPYVMGRDLIEAGMTPGPSFSAALEHAHKLRLAGLTKEEQVRQTLGMYHKQNGEP